MSADRIAKGAEQEVARSILADLADAIVADSARAYFSPPLLECAQNAVSFAHNQVFGVLT